MNVFKMSWLVLSAFVVTLPTVVLSEDVADEDASQYVLETVAEGFEFPWSIAFLPDNNYLVTEREGNLTRVDAQGNKQQVGGIPEVVVRGQGGLMGLILDPDFSENNTIYFTYAHGEKSSNRLRVARAQLDENNLKDLQVIFETSAPKTTKNHFGGRLLFDTEGYLYITVGDGQELRERAQLVDNHFGKVMRIYSDGHIPLDNPYVGDDKAMPQIWSYGHRNQQGIVQLDSGEIVAIEHGARGGDELNLIEPGNNYGWPHITYGKEYTGLEITPYTEAEGMEQPLVYWVPSIAPAGLAYYNGDAFPQWKGDLFVAALAERTIRRLDMDGTKVLGQTIMFRELGERMRDVRMGPDGYLYLLTDDDEGKVLRVKPK